MLNIQGISKSFNGRAALSDVSFDVAGGRLTGFVGGNGAGKTTAMRIMLGVLQPDSGQVLIDGHPVRGADLRGFGYMPEERGLYPKMELVDQLAYLARLHGVSKSVAVRRADDLLERFGLAERRRDKLESLSLGNQQRVQVAAALVHEPDVLVLDEPFSGLDPLAVDEVVAIIGEHAARGIPVLFSSHQLEVVERLSDDLVIIAGGQIRAADTREGLRARFSGNQWSLEATSDAGWVRDVPRVTVDELAGDNVIFTAPQEIAQQVLSQAVSRGAVRSFSPVRRSLGEIFRDVVVDVPRTESEAA
ncbi:ATP-binding cassette domain-containing protein [Epidermidibacterium keratini]|uniref:ATP-binding cassette domain-containing protein n=1 Tax=Epidermidibacterium keratini TaxID=1891644 RepID=A0A7L4YRF3_9ACTN|nr:ATP-binding cassette domain-containing protein [Epidermidibacterium keratini]QHC01147.1 ATP-binding cassette domain-containing protein [Epidermidibacterium keratini]